MADTSTSGPGAVIEILSTRKLVLLIMALILMQITFFLVGGLIAPRPSDAQQHIMSNCIPVGNGPGDQIITRKNCHRIDNLHGEEALGVSPGDLVLMTAIPRPYLAMIPWFQYLLALLEVNLTFQIDNKYIPNSKMLLDVNILYSNEDDYETRQDPKAWKSLARCTEERLLECSFAHEETEEHEGFEYDCELLHLFQLGSVPHKYYLVNLRLPEVNGSEFNQFGHTKEMSVIAIRQTGGFTKVWMCLKAALTCIMAFPVIWFWRRIRLLQRRPMLIEKAIFSLGISMLFVNLPLEIISIYFEAPWMLFFTDVRQGFFYFVLFSFWIIFTGEHLMDQPNRNKLSVYKWQLGAIFTAMVAMLAFDVAERGMQLVNPCATVWTHHNVAMVLIIVASIAGSVYFLLLCFMVVKVFRSISYKQTEKKYRVIVRRFRILMLLSVATAGLTVVFYILSQKYDGLLDWGEHHVEVSSAFFTGVYGLWNIYVFLVLSVYAPSHKQFNLDEAIRGDSRQELIALNQTGDEQTEITDQTRILELTQVKDRED